MVGSTRIGADSVAALARELGVDRTFQCLKGILDHADRRFRAALCTLPDGRYEGVEITDNDCFESVDIEIRAAVEISGDSVTVDSTGTDPQIKDFKNSSIANTHSAVFLAFTTFFDPDIPRNEGTYRAIEIIVPEGTIINARAPAPMTMCTVSVGHEIIHAVWKALAQADPSRASAGWAKNIHGGTAGGIGTDRPFMIYHWNAMPGAGTFRGGTGVDYEAEVTGASQHSFRGEGLATPSGYGTQGGGGWGDPLGRDPDLALRDVRDGLVSRAAARDIYGVIVDDDGRSLDLAATQHCRDSLRQPEYTPALS
ncbi:MAG: hypothetical protein CL569_08360 [Alphaproteobacteria bacterium]|nr:hypothetical protein [Alphaproteobacteria bacterium]|tara:strand:+ start:303 stop:1235 length:933 start_codon:yes stop_codon:yes gene_type:complete